MGAGEISALWSDPSKSIALSVLSLPEFESRLRTGMVSKKEVRRAIQLYFDELAIPLPADRSVVDEAVRLRQQIPSRIPIVDACIAATARLEGCVLVHRDRHFASLPTDVLRQLVLPSRS